MCSSQASRQRNALLLDRLQSVAIGDLAISAITAAEIEFGLAKNRPAAATAARMQALRQALATLPVDAEVAAVYGPLRDTLRRKGTLIGPNDLWIAAHALSSGRTLVTGNEPEFTRVPGLAVENWLR